MGFVQVENWKYPISVLFNTYYKNAFQVIVKSSWAQTHENTSQTTVNTCVGHKYTFQVDFDRQLNPSVHQVPYAYLEK